MNKLEFVEVHANEIDSLEKEIVENSKKIEKLVCSNRLIKERMSLKITLAGDHEEYENNLKEINELAYGNILGKEKIVKSQNIIASALLTEDWD